MERASVYTQPQYKQEPTVQFDKETKEGDMMKILDATCAYRGFWLEKHNKDTIYIDIRPEVKPDIVASCTSTPFADKTFDLILFDPPHKNMGYAKTSNSKKRNEMADRYGTANSKERMDLVKGAFMEFKRILKDDGIVLFKWSSVGTKFSKIIKLRGDFVPMFAQNFNKIKSYETTWMALRKDLKGKQVDLHDKQG